MAKDSYIRKFINLANSIPKYDRIANKIVAGENVFVDIMKATSRVLADRIGKKLKVEIKEAGIKTVARKEKQKQDIGDVEKKIEESRKGIQESIEDIAKYKGEIKNTKKLVDEIQYQFTLGDTALLDEVKKHLNDKKELNKFNKYVGYMEEQIKRFVKFKSEFLRKNKEELHGKKTLGKKSTQFLKEWQDGLKDINKIGFLSDSESIKKKQIGKLKMLMNLTSDNALKNLQKKQKTLTALVRRQRAEIEEAHDELVKRKKIDDKAKKEEAKLTEEIADYGELISFEKENIRDMKEQIRVLNKELKKIKKTPIYEDSDLETLKKVESELGDKKKKSGIYRESVIYAPLMKTIGEIAMAGGLKDSTSRIDIAKRVEKHLIDWDMHDLDFRKLAGSATIATLLAFLKSRASFYAMKERDKIIKDIQRNRSFTVRDEEGREKIDSLTYGDGLTKQEKIKPSRKADTRLDSSYWKEIQTILKTSKVRDKIIKNSLRVLETEKDEGGRFAPHSVYNGWIPKLKINSKWRKKEFRSDSVGGKKMTDSELKKIWNDLLDKVYTHVDEGLWERRFRDTSVVNSIVRMMGVKSKNSTAKRVAGVVWNNVLLNVIDILDKKLDEEREDADKEEVGIMFGEFGQGHGERDIEALYKEIDDKKRLLKRVRMEAEMYATGKLVVADVLASNNITREFLEPKEMIVLLRSKYHKMKKADSNCDDLEKRLNHLMDETTEEEAPIGQYNNQITYGPRRDTVNRKYSHVVKNIVAFVLKRDGELKCI